MEYIKRILFLLVLAVTAVTVTAQTRIDDTPQVVAQTKAISTGPFWYIDYVGTWKNFKEELKRGEACPDKMVIIKCNYHELTYYVMDVSLIESDNSRTHMIFAMSEKEYSQINKIKEGKIYNIERNVIGDYSNNKKRISDFDFKVFLMNSYYSIADPYSYPLAYWGIQRLNIDGKDIVRMLLPAWENEKYTASSFCRKYFEIPYEEFKKLIIK